MTSVVRLTMRRGFEDPAGSREQGEGRQRRKNSRENQTGVYVPTCRRGETPQMKHDRKPDYETTVLVSNLSRDATKRRPRGPVRAFRQTEKDHFGARQEDERF